MFLLNNFDQNKFFLIAGPCVIEGEEMAHSIAGRIKKMTDDLGIDFIFKGSYKKANRTRLDSFTGIGDLKALNILKNVGESLGIPVTTDIHSPEDAKMAADFVDILQIPAFLCRQTELLIAASVTNRIVNVKKGQFLSPESMAFAVDKIRKSGNDQILLTERGTTFGYQDLVVDFRSIPIMQGHGVPVVMDCTHSLQQPNQKSGVTGGDPDMIGTMAKAAIAVGADGLFIETHPDPQQAKSDGANMLHLDKLEGLLNRLIAIKKAL